MLRYVLELLIDRKSEVTAYDVMSLSFQYHE